MAPTIHISVSPSVFMTHGSISASVRLGMVPPGDGAGDGVIHGDPAGAGHGIPVGTQDGIPDIFPGMDLGTTPVTDLSVRTTDGLLVRPPDVALPEATIMAVMAPRVVQVTWAVPRITAITVRPLRVTGRRAVLLTVIPMVRLHRTTVAVAETADMAHPPRLLRTPTADIAVPIAITATVVRRTAIAVRVADLTAAAAAAMAPDEAGVAMEEAVARAGGLPVDAVDTNFKFRRNVISI